MIIKCAIQTSRIVWIFSLKMKAFNVSIVDRTVTFKSLILYHHRKCYSDENEIKIIKEIHKRAIKLLAISVG